MFRIRLVAVAALGLAACSDDLADRGGVELSLTGHGASGAVYRLRDAQLTIAPAGLVFRTEDDPTRTTLSAHLDAGLYTVSLAPGWRLERVGQHLERVATLTTANPLAFEVLAGQRTPVILGFRVDGEAVPLGRGDADIGIEVDDAAPDAGVEPTIDASTDPDPDAAVDATAPAPDAAAPPDATTRPPDVAIFRGPTGPTRIASQTFEFVAFRAASIVCRVDDGELAPCASPFNTGLLGDGAHTFEVRAVGADGQVAVDTRDFVVDTVAPVVTITSGPSSTTFDNPPTFEFTVSELAQVKCTVDNHPAVPCTSPFTTPLLSTGGLPASPHGIWFEATDAADNSSRVQRLFVLIGS